MAHACAEVRIDVRAACIGGGGGEKGEAGLVTLRMTFSERELIPSYNRLWGRYGKLLHRYLSCLGDHQSTGAGGDATVLKGGMCVCACGLVYVLKNVLLFCHKCHS